jgi:predicted O-linked N-acetylglucosamine transferase (SPINDLY family)
MADYEAKALTLARNPTELSALKEKLKQARTSAPLFDAEGFRRAIEDAFISMHKQD